MGEGGKEGVREVSWTPKTEVGKRGAAVDALLQYSTSLVSTLVPTPVFERCASSIRSRTPPPPPLIARVIVCKTTVVYLRCGDVAVLLQ